MGAESLQIGRDSERELLASTLRDSASGRPGAVLVAGEPGIGKTSLVAEVTSGPAAAGHLVLWGHCLRFGAESSPYLPIGQMLTQWHRQADESERARVLTGAEHLVTIAPPLGTTTDTPDSARVLALAATVLDRIAAATPLVLIVDDAQWADGTSLDLLAYELAGFGAGQQLCLLITYRDTELGVGHRLHGWLADAVRLPSVSRIRLERLGFADAEELVIELRGEEDGGPPAAEVFEKADGNPYYTELLVRGSGDGSERDGDLREALLSSWHRLDHDAREVLQLLALSGRPVALDVLERLSAARGGAPRQVATALTDATAAGLTTVSSDGEAWFHHPLVAEVVTTTLTPTSRHLIHQQYVEVIESSGDLAMASRAAHLALHHHGAGDSDQAFSWSLRAADEAAAVRGYAEEFDHLHRACRLWDDVSTDTRPAAGERIELWRRACESAWNAGEYLLAVRLREEAIELADEGTDPVHAVRLRLPLPAWREFCGLDDVMSVAATRRVLELAAECCPGTAEHVQALARHAHAQSWDADEEFEPHAAAAVRIARRIGSPEALAWALGARSQTYPWLLADATQALTLARELDDPELLRWATTATANRLFYLGRDREAAELRLTTFRQLLDSGSVNEAKAAGPTPGALTLLDFGEWDEVREVLRWLLSQRLPPYPAAAVRGVAALLALRTGNVAAGRTHLARARELDPRQHRPGQLLPIVEVEACWALGQPREALALAERLMPALVVLDTIGGDEVLLFAARAAGDLAEEPGSKEEAVSLLGRIEQLRGQDPPSFAPTSPGDLIHPARGAVFAADRARCRADGDAPTRWRAAVSACDAAEMVWHEALASYQLARALLQVRGSRGEAASALRHAARLATDLGAGPICRDAEELARQAHIPLDEPAAAGPASSSSDPLSGLTPREREVLSHVVAGRTYAEIAQALFISEKTVSVHVSNLLRKTGTRSRVEVAELARRASPAP